MKVVPVLFALTLSAILGSLPSEVEPPAPPPVEDIRPAIDVICYQLVDTSANWATREFGEWEGHYFCSEECFAKYLELIKQIEVDDAQE